MLCLTVTLSGVLEKSLFIRDGLHLLISHSSDKLRLMNKAMVLETESCWNLTKGDFPRFSLELE